MQQNSISEGYFYKPPKSKYMLPGVRYLRMCLFLVAPRVACPM